MKELRKSLKDNERVLRLLPILIVIKLANIKTLLFKYVMKSEKI